MSVNSLGGAKYYVLFIDDFSGYQFVFCIKNKTKVLECFKKVKGESKRMTRNFMLKFQSDNLWGWVHQLGVQIVFNECWNSSWN